MGQHGGGFQHGLAQCLDFKEGQIRSAGHQFWHTMFLPLLLQVSRSQGKFGPGELVISDRDHSALVNTPWLPTSRVIFVVWTPMLR